MIDNATQALGLLLVIYGSWMAGNLRIRAYAAKLTGSIIQIYVGVVHDVWMVWALGLLLAILQIRAIVKWYRAGVVW